MSLLPFNSLWPGLGPYHKFVSAVSTTCLHISRYSAIFLHSPLFKFVFSRPTKCLTLLSGVHLKGKTNPKVTIMTWERRLRFVRYCPRHNHDTGTERRTTLWQPVSAWKNKPRETSLYLQLSKGICGTGGWRAANSNDRGTEMSGDRWLELAEFDTCGH